MVAAADQIKAVVAVQAGISQTSAEICCLLQRASKQSQLALVALLETPRQDRQRLAEQVPKVRLARSLLLPVVVVAAAVAQLLTGMDAAAALAAVVAVVPTRPSRYWVITAQALPAKATTAAKEKEVAALVIVPVAAEAVPVQSEEMPAL